MEILELILGFTIAALLFLFFDNWHKRRARKRAHQAAIDAVIERRLDHWR